MVSDMKQKLSRRSFVQMSSAGLVASPFAMVPIPLNAADGEMRIEDLIVFNALGGISNQNLWARQSGQGVENIANATLARVRNIDSRAIRDTRDSDVTAINVTLGYVAGPEEPYEYTIDDIARWNALIRRHPEDLLKVWTVNDILRAKEEDKIGIVFGFQNARSVGNRLERVSTFSNLGVRIIQLTYNGRNQIGDGSSVAENKGLTPFGFELIEALSDNRVLIDLSHSGENTCLDAVKSANVPITISHTGCRALVDIPRNKTDEEMRLVAEKGGVVGIYFMPFLRHDGQARAADVIRHIEHAVNVCGEEHVGIGTDGDATAIDDMSMYRAAIAEEVRQRRQAGIGAAGETDQVVPLIPDLMGPTQFQKLAEMLARRGHSSARIEKILGKNFLRLIREVW